MYINCKQFINATYEPKIYNLSDHLIQALDIYFISEDADYYNKTLEPITYGTNIGLSKFVVRINDIEYPITKGQPGEGPLNPIIYKPSVALSKVKFRNSSGEIFATAFAGMDIEISEGVYDDSWERNTNMAITPSDYITISIIENEQNVDFKKLYGYGAGTSNEDHDRCPYSGYRADLLIGYGGYGYDQLIAKMQLVIEESSVNRNNFTYLYNEES